ncbi:MAG: site-specific integrase [Chloroflexi bacterium]|nr:site-specific integrase [Chloroflexota bacterium]
MNDITSPYADPFPPSVSLITAHDRDLQSTGMTPLSVAGQAANRAAGATIFQRYLQEKSTNTIKRHARDLELFAEYLIDVGIPLINGANFQDEPLAWQGVTWGIVEGFVQWLLREGYAIASINARLSTVRTYARMAVKAGTVDRQEGLLIATVRGFSRQGGANADARRPQSRKAAATYDYKPEGSKKRVVVERRSTKKNQPTIMGDRVVAQLKHVQNTSPQAWRDALLMCLLLDHGLRASEVALLKISNFDLAAGEMRFFRPKVKGTAQEWSTHKLTPQTLQIVSHYIKKLYPPTLKPNGGVIVATSRLLKDGKGGLLRSVPLSRIRVSERVAYLGEQLGIDKLSAHDCRHYCATKMARLGYGVDELMAWFGWTSAQTAMRYVTSTEVQDRYKG